MHPNTKINTINQRYDTKALISANVRIIKTSNHFIYYTSYLTCLTATTNKPQRQSPILKSTL
nr:MAG TPA: hypothetical protein [Caudoviricetes sp.]